jgi:ClpP class serine protease
MKAHAVHRLLASLYNKPHLVDKTTFIAATDYLKLRNAGMIDFGSADTGAPAKETFDTARSIGVIDISGPLTYKPTMFQALCGGCSYEDILDQASTMIDAGVKTIIMNCDSGGGEAYGCFEAADELRRMCDAGGVQLSAYVDGMACSAMYGLACVADEIVVNPYAEVGSIGVLIALMNDSEAMKQAGVERTFITDGTEKVPFAADGSFREGFIQDLQARVSELGDSFRQHVSKHTGLSVEELKATNAKVYSAKDALAMGLVNKIQTRSEYISYIADKHKGNS